MCVRVEVHGEGATGGRLPTVLMRPPPQLSVKTRGGGGGQLGGGGSLYKILSILSINT